MDVRRIWLMVFSAAWLLAFGQSFVAFTQGGETAGVELLGWQAVAGLLSLPILVLGRAWPCGTAVRRLTWVPFALAMLAVLAVSTAGYWER